MTIVEAIEFLKAVSAAEILAKIAEREPVLTLTPEQQAVVDEVKAKVQALDSIVPDVPPPV